MSQINFNSTKTYVGKRSKRGELRDIYSPFFNLIKYNKSNTGHLDDFTDPQFNFDMQHPVDLTIQDSYDGSVNVILNDDKNRPRLINSRFSVQEDKKYLIPDHKGMKDTNLYDSNTFDIDTSLKKITTKIPKLSFEGLEDGGEMPCGSYTFYFKFVDADDNETEVVAESGLVQCHIGKVNDPGNIRMGMRDENSQKIVKFKLTNLDSGFDYVKVLYVRNSSDLSRALVPTFTVIDYKYPILNETCDIYIRGTEPKLAATADDILIDYADIEAVKTQELDDNILFFGNIAEAEHDWEALAKLARLITVSTVLKNNIGYLNKEYKDVFTQNPDEAFGYYNMKNVYYRVGYWPDEFYRFGIVYIFDDDSLSPVFNILGGIVGDSEYTRYALSPTNVDYEPEEFFYDEEHFINSKGVVRLPNVNIINTTKLGMMECSPLGLCFTLNGEDPIKELLKNKVKGFFYVRQLRIPTIVGQGLVIGKTTKDFGSLPVLKGDSQYVTRGFLGSNSVIHENDLNLNIPNNHVRNNALLVPDAVLRELDFNQMFVSNDWALKPIGRCSFNYNPTTGISEFNKFYSGEQLDSVTSKLITVPENTRILTNGETDENGLVKDEQYFSTMAGTAAEPYKAVNVQYVWNKTVPQKLTNDQHYVRGLFGQYVGMSHTEYPYGTLLNIKKDLDQTTTQEQFNTNEFMSRMQDSSTYHAISDRIGINEEDTRNLICYRGDCYVSFFTHRIIRNFIDPDLPTNTKIVDPLTWAKNYAVRCTCDPNQEPYSNLKKDYTGWYIPEDDSDPYTLDDFNLQEPSDEEKQSSGIVPVGAKERDDYKIVPASDYNNGFVNEIAKSFEVYVGSNRLRNNIIRVVHPKDQENQSGLLNLKSIFHSSVLWEMRGISNLNRGDINAVQIGQWITFPICSSSNICLRDVDSNNPTEEALMSQKRSFYPLESRLSANKLADSHVINGACSVSIPFKPNLLIPDAPFFRLEYSNRVYYSDFDDTNRIRNAYRIFKETSYKDYPKMYGPITKLIELNKQLVCVCDHGVLVLPVHERILAGNGQGEMYINEKNVLPEFPIVITDSFGSMWKDSVIATKSGVYGVDTVAKKIWKYNGQQYLNISDLRVQKFLNRHLDLSEFDKQEYVGHVNVKAHYNQFKHDIIFTFYNDKPIKDKNDNIVSWERGETWALCFNEDLEQFITFYDWIPLESANVDNIWFSFDRDKMDEVYNANILNSGTILKSRIDKAFTTKTSVAYLNSNYSKQFTSLGKFSAITFYINTLDSNVKLRLRRNNHTYVTETLNTGNQWRFITCLLNSPDAIVDLIASTNYELCELKITEISEDDKEFRQLLAEIKDPIAFRKPIIVDPNSEPLFISLRTNDDRFMELWKHGQAGIYDNQGKIKPTHWYGKQHEFNFEFVVSELTSVQKIFNNLKLISNSVEPYKFEYEIDGECYNWSEYKDVIEWINLHSTDQTSFDTLYTEVLSLTYGDLRNKYVDFPQLFNRDASYKIAKLPYMKLKLTERKGTKDASIHINEDPKYDSYKDNSSQTCLIEDEPLSEKRVRTEQLGNDIRKYGRLRGNMEYLEDAWDVEIRPIQFKFAYFDGELKFTSLEETRNRDKYLRVKVRYTGEDLAVIQGVTTLFEYSFA